MNSHRFSLFVPHGAPMFALQPGAAGAALAEMGSLFRAARAVVVVSPHWETEIPEVGFAARPATIHDFGGLIRGYLKFNILRPEIRRWPRRYWMQCVLRAFRQRQIQGVV